MQKLRTINALGDLRGKTVLLAANFDVPVDEEKVTENYRIKAVVPTIKFLIEKNARIVILSHLGRPGGKYKDNLSLMPVRFELGKLLEQHVKFAHIASSRNSIIFMEDGEVLLLENVRFDPRQESTKKTEREEFVKDLVQLADYYVNDAFATHRTPSAYTIEAAEGFKKPMAGLLIQKEIEQLSKLKNNMPKPFVAVIGGVKLETKIPILENLVTRTDSILVGGAMAYTFLKAQGIKMGKSHVEANMLKKAAKIIKAAKKNKCNLMLPVDHIAGEEFEENTKPIEVNTQHIPSKLIGLDIGERTMDDYQEVIENAKTIFWNGPMGVFEWENFGRGTEAVGEYIGLSAPKSTFKVAGGGDTIAAMGKLKINMKNYDHISAGGGAMLNFLTDGDFPALELLEK